MDTTGEIVALEFTTFHTVSVCWEIRLHLCLYSDYISGELKTLGVQDGTATALSIENDSAFRQIRSLTIFVRENFGSDQTKIDWIGLKGERLDVKIGGIVQVT
jgi:hypothetical protein